MESNPQGWSVENCCDELMDSPKSDKIDSLIWDLRGTVFFELKRMGKFDVNAVGPDNQEYVDKVMRGLMDRI